MSKLEYPDDTKDIMDFLSFKSAALGSLALGPCRCAEGQADKCPPPAPSEHLLNRFGF